MEKNVYFLICFIISFAFFVSTANALTEISADSGSNYVLVENSAPSTIFDGPPPTIFDGPPDSIFDGPQASEFDTNGGVSQSHLEKSDSSIPNISNSNSQRTQIEMQITGFPVSLIILAILLVFGGFIGFKRKIK